jgi:DNA-binding LacI/PurR family transcriptional regulator
VTETNYDLDLMERAVGKLIEQNRRGVAIMTSEVSVAWLQEMVHLDIPVVGFDLDFSSSRVSNIQVDYVAGMEQVIGHLHHIGLRLGLKPGPILADTRRWKAA